jgi:hypothetical protein
MISLARGGDRFGLPKTSYGKASHSRQVRPEGRDLRVAMPPGTEDSPSHQFTVKIEVYMPTPLIWTSKVPLAAPDGTTT